MLTGVGWYANANDGYHHMSHCAVLCLALFTRSMAFVVAQTSSSGNICGRHSSQKDIIILAWSWLSFVRSYVWKLIILRAKHMYNSMLIHSFLEYHEYLRRLGIFSVVDADAMFLAYFLWPQSNNYFPLAHGIVWFWFASEINLPIYCRSKPFEIWMYQCRIREGIIEATAKGPSKNKIYQEYN